MLAFTNAFQLVIHSFLEWIYECLYGKNVLCGKSAVWRKR